MHPFMEEKGCLKKTPQRVSHHPDSPGHLRSVLNGFRLELGPRNVSRIPSSSPHQHATCYLFEHGAPHNMYIGYPPSSIYTPEQNIYVSIV